MSEQAERAFWPSVWRALRGRCPNCGKGKLFKSYLKQVDHCEVCDEAWIDIRADDGPAWLTILLTGHLIAFPLVSLVMDTTLSTIALISIIFPAVLILALTILPRAKGFFIAAIWTMRAGSN